eukprot:1716632-Pyramimonas_sp.AAC.1
MPREARSFTNQKGNSTSLPAFSCDVYGPTHLASSPTRWALVTSVDDTRTPSREKHPTFIPAPHEI